MWLPWAISLPSTAFSGLCRRNGDCNQYLSFSSLKGHIAGWEKVSMPAFFSIPALPLTKYWFLSMSLNLSGPYFLFLKRCDELVSEILFCVTLLSCLSKFKKFNFLGVFIKIVTNHFRATVFQGRHTLLWRKMPTYCVVNEDRKQRPLCTLSNTVKRERMERDGLLRPDFKLYVQWHL